MGTMELILHVDCSVGVTWTRTGERQAWILLMDHLSFMRVSGAARVHCFGLECSGIPWTFVSFLSSLPTPPPPFFSTSRTILHIAGRVLKTILSNPSIQLYIPCAADSYMRLSRHYRKTSGDGELNVFTKLGLWEVFFPLRICLPAIFTHCFWLHPLELSRIIPLHFPHPLKADWILEGSNHVFISLPSSRPNIICSFRCSLLVISPSHL